MIRSLTIKGYRGFELFNMQGLGRVNLLVGTNNCGKTSILEALQLVNSEGRLSSMMDIMMRRGEMLDRDERTGDEEEYDVRHLFRGHTAEVGTRFVIDAVQDSAALSWNCEVERARDGEEPGADPTSARLWLTGNASWDGGRRPFTEDLSARGGIRAGVRRRMGAEWQGTEDAPGVMFVPTDSLTPHELGRFWGSVALAPAEEIVVKALQQLEPSVERIAYVGERKLRSGDRGGFVVKCRDSIKPVPLGSMGDGIWRLLSLLLASVRAEKGMLLVDEIDTGLHYTAMVDMWKAISVMAEDLDVQVFATTHSWDCVESLASICRADAKGESEVSIQRIEPEHGRSVSFTEEEIRTAAEHRIEVR